MSKKKTPLDGSRIFGETFFFEMCRLKSKGGRVSVSRSPCCTENLAIKTIL